MIYHMQDDENEFLDHITKENHNKVQSIFFLASFLQMQKLDIDLQS